MKMKRKKTFIDYLVYMQHYVIWFHKSKFSYFLVTLDKTVCVSHYYAFFPDHTIEAEFMK